MKSSFQIILSLVLCAIAAGPAHAALIVGNTADAERHGDGSLQNAAATVLQVGSTTSTDRSNAIYVFDISGVTGTFTTASLSIYYNQRLDGPNNNVDLWGVGFGSTSAIPSTADYNAAATDSNATLLQTSFTTPTTTQSTTLSTTAAGNASLLAYLNTRPSGSAGNFVFLRLSLPGDEGNGNHGYEYGSANGTSNQPGLTYTNTSDTGGGGVTVASPEPGSLTLLAAGIGLMAGYGWRRRKKALA